VSEFAFKSAFNFGACGNFPVDHIGVAVENLDEAIAFYKRSFGCEVDLREVVEDQKVELAFLRTANTLIELLTPAPGNTTLTKFLKTRGPGLHHICYLVSDIRSELRRLEGLGMELIDKTPRPGAHKSLIAFIHPKSTLGVLTELCERRHA
jgi:methylmalonyl-CoA/ethylmalonyl-CoA epimerase